jgi:hypothetical protein
MSETVMDLFHRKNLLATRNHQSVVWTFTDANRGESFAETFIRSPDGVYYLCEPYTAECPALPMLFRAAYERGLHSPRPFHLSAPSDDSLFYSALALATSCCMAWNLNPLPLLSEAHSATRVTAFNLFELKQQARWERTVFPGTWDTASIMALCDVLEAIDAGRFAQVILERTVRARGH